MAKTRIQRLRAKRAKASRPQFSVSDFDKGIPGYSRNVGRRASRKFNRKLQAIRMMKHDRNGGGYIVPIGYSEDLIERLRNAITTENNQCPSNI